MKKFIPADELILNDQGRIYHLDLQPEQIANIIITVGDPNRVGAITKHFDSIEVKVHKREFFTETGYFRNCRITVISTGIGTDNVDIVMNEIDALANIDFKTRMEKEEKTVLSFVRIGTSGSIQPDIPLDTIVASVYGIGMDGLLHFYKGELVFESLLTKKFNEEIAPPIPAYATIAYKPWLSTLPNDFVQGMTCTNTGFYGPQGRNLRLESALDLSLLSSFGYQNLKITNFEMETAALYGLASLMGHKAMSLNVILANRANKQFSSNPLNSVDVLIERSLDWIIETLG